MHNIQLLINKQNLRDFQFTEQPQSTEADISTGEVLLQVESFALTANNITYAVAGEQMGYWQFFPAPEGFGRIPVWGFAAVTASKNPDINVGERCYGYLPMGTQLVVSPTQISSGQFIDGADHRAHLPPVYNQLLRVRAPADPEADAQQMLYRPLFMTSWLLDDFLTSNNDFGADAVLLTSASSKTSIGLAECLAHRKANVIGLTSPGNIDFVKSLGCYETVVSYDGIEQLERQPTVSVDMAGNGQTLAAIHDHFDEDLKYSCLVGATHWEQRQGASDLAGPTPKLFFAPDHIKSRSEEWGPNGLNEQFDPAWQRFTRAASNWIEVQHLSGKEALGQLYLSLLDGEASPQTGYIASL